MDTAKRLGEESIGKLLFRMSLPAMVGMMVNALYNMVDRIFIGQVEGTSAIAGLTISFPLMIILFGFAMLIGIGGTALISMNLGMQKKEEAEQVLGNSFVLMVIFGVILSVLGLIFLEPILKLFSASAEALPYSRAYLSIILYGTVFQMVSFGVNRFIGAEGNAIRAMATMIVGAVSNIIFDAIFILGMGMGVRGAALGTILAQLVTSVWVLSYFLLGKSIVKFHVKNLKLDIKIIGKIFAIGMAPFAMQVASSVITFIFNKQLAFYGGDTAISVLGIINSIAMFMLMPIFGLNQGMQPIISYNYGAKAYDRVLHTLKLSCIVATIIVTIAFAMGQLAPELLMSLFNSKDTALIEMGSSATRIFMSMFPFIGFQIVCSTYFQAVGKAVRATFLSLTRQVIFLIPMLLILPNFFGLTGVWMAPPISDVASSLVTAVAIIYEINFLLKEKKKLAIA